MMLREFLDIGLTEYLMGCDITILFLSFLILFIILLMMKTLIKD